MHRYCLCLDDDNFYYIHLSEFNYVDDLKFMLDNLVNLLLEHGVSNDEILDNIKLELDFLDITKVNYSKLKNGGNYEN